MTDMSETHFEDLKMVYENGIQKAKMNLAMLQPSLIELMKEFISLHNLQEELNAKLGSLLADESEEDQEECGHCNGGNNE